MLLGWSIVVLLLLAGCGGDGGNSAPSGSVTGSPSGATPDNFERLPTQMELPAQVMVTLPLFEDFVRRAGGDNVEVESLIPPGVDPHSYEPTPQDIERMAGIDFFFVNGAGLDSHLTEIIEANRDETAYVIPFAPNVRSPQGNGLYAEEAGDNAHLWLDPDLADIYPEIVADTFVIYDGINQAFYDSNFRTMGDEIAEFTAEARATLEAVPLEGRTLFTYHDSFVHFARRFGFSVSGFAVNTPGDSLSSIDLSSRADTVTATGAAAVFAEYGYDTSVMETIAARAGAQTCTIASDILPEGMTVYLDMMRANVAEIVRCLADP